MTPGASGLSVENLNKVFHLIYRQVGGNPANKMTRQDLQRLSGTCPPETILGCLITYEGDKLIVCTNNDIIFTPKNLKDDYNEFHITSEGRKTDSPYKI